MLRVLDDNFCTELLLFPVKPIVINFNLLAVLIASIIFALSPDVEIAKKISLGLPIASICLE